MCGFALIVACLRISCAVTHLIINERSAPESELSRAILPDDALANLLFQLSPTHNLYETSTRRSPSRFAVPSMAQSGGLTRGELMKRIGLAFTLAQLGDVPSASADGSTYFSKLPKVDHSTDKERCIFTSSSMGQANAARDSLYDLRECTISGIKAEGVDISGAFLAGGDFSKTNFKEAQLSKVYAVGAKFDGADFTSAVLDRGQYRDASFRGTIFNNAVLSGASFEGADLTDADFTEAFIGDYEQKQLCKNPTLTGENPTTGAPTKESLGCTR